jgi:hypothetical protein
MRLDLPFFLLPLLFFTNAAVAELKWEKTLQQFQRSPEDKEIAAHYTFRNVGATPVTIKTLRSSCGCTTARMEKKTYAPGEQGEVVVIFVFGGRKDLHRKTVTVTTDDKTQEPTLLDLRVDIRDALTLTPALVYWKTGEPVAAKKVQLAAEPGQPVRIKSVASSNPRLPATLETIKAGAAYAVSVKPADTAQKESAEISVQTDFPPDAPRTYIIHARIK